MYTPLLRIVDSKNINIPINVGDMDQILESVKGYYEFVAAQGEEKIALRFNIEAFRNNYQLTDISRVRITCYGILVGSVTQAQLNIKAQFPSDSGAEPVAPHEVMAGSAHSTEDIHMKMYDVILAGIDSNE